MTESEIKMEVYKGSKPYMFVSYSHADSQIVIPILELLYKERYRFWFDDGIHSGDEWAEVIEQRVTDSACVLVFLSQSAIESQNCRKEIHFAQHVGKKLKLVQMGNVTYGHGLGLQLIDLDHDVYEGDAMELVRTISDDASVQACRKEAISSSYEFWWPHNQSGFASYPSNNDEENGEMLTPWGPERECYEHGKHPKWHSINSCTNHPIFGDERSFVRIREKGTDRWLKEVMLAPGKTYEVRVHYRVNGDPELNKTGKTIADGVRASVYVPEIVFPQKRGTIRGALYSADTRDRKELWSCVRLYAVNDPLFLRFIPASSRIHNRGKTDDRVLSTSLFSPEGVYLGVNELDGRIPAGDDYAGSIGFEFRVVSHHGDYTIERSVSVNGGKYKTGFATVSCGDNLTFRTRFRNGCDTRLTNVTFIDSLPAGLSPKPGTTIFIDTAKNKRERLGDGIARNGYNVGTYGQGVSSVIEYDATVPEIGVPLNLFTQSRVAHDGGSRASNLLLHVSGAWDDPAETASGVMPTEEERTYLGHVPNGGWGPTRETFTIGMPAPRATFNSITDNPTVGDERAFVRIAPVGSGLSYDRRLRVTPGLLYELWIGYDNSAAPSTGEMGVARDVRVSVSFPSHLSPYDWKYASAVISSRTATPQKVWAQCSLWSTSPVRLRYVPQSAELHNEFHKALKLDERLFSREGIPIGTTSLDGVIPSANEEAYGFITLLLAAEPDPL